MIGRFFLGRYETIRILGEGGMGRVYLARQQDLGRQVVVKVMHDHIAADPKFCDRFQRETLLMARFPDYRDTFEYLGSYAVATKPDKPLDEMHVVYARPEDVRAYRRDGKFPDGATLVKEVTRVGSEMLTTGQSHWATDVKLWFVMIKDAKGRFPGNDLWGDGWGWALFLAKEPARNVATDYSTDCRTCHVPAKKDDWVYVRGYPALKR